MATVAMAVLVSMSFSTSLAIRRLRPSHAKVRLMTHERPGGLSSDSRRERGQQTVEAPRQEVEARGITRALDDLQSKLVLRRCALRLDGVVATVGKHDPESRKSPLEWLDNQHEAVAILDARAVNGDDQRQAQRIGEQMTLAAHDLLARVEALDSAGFCRLHALAVDDCRTRRGLLAGLLAPVRQQRCPDPRPDAELPELAKIPVDRRIRRDARGQ